jgi:hypothetical protein
MNEKSATMTIEAILSRVSRCQEDWLSGTPSVALREAESRHPWSFSERHGGRSLERTLFLAELRDPIQHSGRPHGCRRYSTSASSPTRSIVAPKRSFI